MTLSLSLPTSWAELSDAQLRYAAALFVADAWTAAEVRTLCFLRFTGLEPVSGKPHHYIYKGNDIRILPLEIAAAAETLDFLFTPPTEPRRPEIVGEARAIHPRLYGLPFGEWLKIENYWQGYLATRRPEPLEQIADALYPERSGTLTAADGWLIALWLTSVKELFAQTFSNLFQPDSHGGSSPEANRRELMDAQIRALTGGDITKETIVLEADTWRALTELDAKAREAAEFNSKTK